MHLDAVMAKNPSLVVSDFAFTEAPKKTDFERHFHHTFELLYILRGRGQFVVEGVCYPMRAGSLLVFRPGEFHYVAPDEDTPYERCVVHFSMTSFGSDAEVILRDLRKIPLGFGNYYAPEELTGDIRTVFKKLREIERIPEEKRTAMTRLLVGQLLLSLSLLPPVTTGDGNAVGARAIRYISAHITEPISLDGLARELLVSKYYLCRAFKEHNGISIRAYIRDKRIMLAKERIASGMKPRDAAFSVGFGDYSSFYRAYKEVTGYAPKEEKTQQ